MNGDSYSRDGGRQGSSRHYSSRGDRDDRPRDTDRRRRSRSPRRSGRRDYEVDTYSSSRDYRERERESTHARRDNRRDERGWDRDARPQRRDRDDDRYSRRDRDPFEDRGGRGRRDRGDRDGFAGRDRKKSTSPPPKKREPTPDLTDVVSVLKRERRMTQWDIKPAGYENITAEQAKLSGMFSLPGAPRTQPMDPARLKALMEQPGGTASASALKPSQGKQAKRLLVHNLPSSATNQSIADFFNLHMNGVNVVSGNDPCISAAISKDKTYALLEFKTTEDATYALALDGISMTEEQEAADVNGDKPLPSGLSIRRPKDYIAPTSTETDEAPEGQVSNVVKDGPNKLSITNIQPVMEEEHVQELLVAFGPLKSFVLAKDLGTGQSRGIAFAVYANEDITDLAIQGLNGLEIDGQPLKIQRASVGITQAAGLENGVNAMTMLAGTSARDQESRVICLMNMVTVEELMDNETYNEIVEDIQEECQNYGHIVELKIPRPRGPRVDAGVGKIFIKYDTTQSAKNAHAKLGGRKFADRTVVVTFFSEVGISRLRVWIYNADDRLGVVRCKCLVDSFEND
ncbi:hypothetical protein GQ43DRAFT_258002 [Delitschia confertaspora ATCC 74209]|uniref:Splicing factor U2AF subunit n=1 Tax=Delitschia confertaspora ATCC 74209 TaxID=1513339 RepID=A0A9P4JQ58_9PLEO|nr:hypothetical protein GQ43DRAFT_258002 [Delitschia confertaspora ATCC 74209]